MDTDGNNRMTQASSSLFPRKINVQKFTEVRAPEIESLHSIVSDRLNRDFRSQRNKRRRTTAYDSQAAKKRYRKRQKSESLVGKANSLDSGKDDGKKIPRRIRRRIEFKGNHETGFSTSGDGTKRLRTHVWHAKRFAMTKLWGFHLPLGLQGRGRGSRAVLKWFKRGVLVHDATYYAAVQLEGPEDSLLSILGMLLDPFPLSHSEEVTRSILFGLTYGSRMLYHVGAPLSQPISPITYMWRPYHISDRPDDGEGLDGIGSDDPHKNGSGSCFRQLWVWIHASSFSEGYNALKLACQKQMNETGILVSCLSLEGQLAKLEVLGPKAFQLLQKTLYPLSCSSVAPSFLRKCAVAKADDNSEIKKFDDLDKEEGISFCAILSRTVMDPRIIPENRVVDNTNSPKTVPEVDSEEPQEIYESLWDASTGLSSPMGENILCAEKHQLRMDFLCLDDPKSGFLKTSNGPQYSRSCPILLVKHKKPKDSPTGWTVILPLNWVRVFWNAFVTRGAHAIGQKEKHWLACEIGLPFFPSDFPDCSAYSYFMASEASALVQKAEQRPPALRPFRIPILPPWNSIKVTLDQFFEQKNSVDGEVLSNVKGKNDIRPCSSHGNSFDGIVARTSLMLTTSLKGINGDNLLLFPRASNGDKNILKFLKDERIHSNGEKTSLQLNYSNRKLCFLRVFLHAHKEGVFEEGAVVCAPCLADIPLWKPSCGNNEGGLTIPQSCVRSYFKEQPSGKWELHVPEDSASRESHRWPIGFVTTRFVRGSKKPKAEAFCDAVLLARLREDQWSNTPAKRRKKEVYVLVRNLRSSAYRLALASIVLELQDEDVESL